MLKFGDIAALFALFPLGCDTNKELSCILIARRRSCLSSISRLVKINYEGRMSLILSLLRAAMALVLLMHSFLFWDPCNTPSDGRLARTWHLSPPLFSCLLNELDYWNDGFPRGSGPVSGKRCSLVILRGCSCWDATRTRNCRAF